MLKERKVFQLQLCEVKKDFQFKILIIRDYSLDKLFFYNTQIEYLKMELVCNICNFFIYFNYQYLIKVNDIKTKKGVELLLHLVEYYKALKV